MFTTKDKIISYIICLGAAYVGTFMAIGIKYIADVKDFKLLLIPPILIGTELIIDLSIKFVKKLRKKNKK